MSITGLSTLRRGTILGEKAQGSISADYNGRRSVDTIKKWTEPCRITSSTRLCFLTTLLFYFKNVRNF